MRKKKAATRPHQSAMRTQAKTSPADDKKDEDDKEKKKPKPKPKKNGKKTAKKEEQPKVLSDAEQRVAEIRGKFVLVTKVDKEIDELTGQLKGKKQEREQLFRDVQNIAMDPQGRLPLGERKEPEKPTAKKKGGKAKKAAKKKASKRKAAKKKASKPKQKSEGKKKAS